MTENYFDLWSKSFLNKHEILPFHKKKKKKKKKKKHLKSDIWKWMHPIQNLYYLAILQMYC